MPIVNRRYFISNTFKAITAVALIHNHDVLDKYRPLLSFSTLGCPDWNFETILNFAVEHGYDGIEFRGILRQLDLTKCPEFSSKKNILASRKLIEDKKLKVVNLGSSAVMHHADAAERKRNLDEAKNFIQLAQQLGSPYIRVFPNNFPKEREKKETIDLIVKGLHELGDYAKNFDVTVLLITHGDVMHIEDLENIMRSVGHDHVGLGWDIANMWSATKEPPEQVYARLKKYIRLTFIKDLKRVDGKEQNALLGKGYTPIFDAIDILAKDGYEGYYSFEWEKYWDPKLEEPELAIADYAKVMKQHFKM